MTIVDAIAKALPAFEDAFAPDPARVAPAAHEYREAAAKPVLQLASIPMTLDAARYRDARSDSNPDGDLIPLYEFRSLVDPVPEFSRFYTPGTASTERTYEAILNGAVVSEGHSFAATVLSKAKKQFMEKSFAPMDGTSGVWRPIYATPQDWYDFSKLDRFRDLNIDLTDQDKDAPYSAIGGPTSLRLSAAGQKRDEKVLDPQTTLRALRMKYMLVSLQRPWLNPLLFQSSGWYLSQQASGFCSSGDRDANTGVFPLLPTALLLATDVSVDAAWSGADRAFIDSAHLSGSPLSVGPFTLDPPGADSSVRVVGWISSLVPYSPKDSDLRSGSVLVTNRGAFICRFSAAWSQNGRQVTEDSGNFPVLAAKSIGIPAGAKAIVVTLEIMTFPVPFETWQTVATLHFDDPARKCFELTGTTIDAQFKEVTCNQ